MNREEHADPLDSVSQKKYLTPRQSKRSPCNYFQMAFFLYLAFLRSSKGRFHFKKSKKRWKFPCRGGGLGHSILELLFFVWVLNHPEMQ